MADTSPSPLLTRPGAQPVPADLACPAYDRVAWHYGNPLGEQKAPIQVVDRSNRAVLKVSGEDRVEFLNLLLSQLITADTDSTTALKLDAQGHVVDIFEVAATNTAFYLIVSPTDVETAQEYLTAMIFWSKVQVDRVDADIAVVSVLTPTASSAPVLTDREVDGLAFARVTDTRVDYGVPRATLAESVAQIQAATGGQLAGLMAFEAYRLAQVEPERSLDVDDKTLIHESRFWLAHALNLNKGCYRGQETVSKVENVGRSPRVKALALIDGSAPTQPVRGDTITLQADPGKTVGTVQTVVDHHMLGPIALVTVSRGAVEKPLQTPGGCALALDAETLPPDGEGGGAALIADYRAQAKDQVKG